MLHRRPASFVNVIQVVASGGQSGGPIICCPSCVVRSSHVANCRHCPTPHFLFDLAISPPAITNKQQLYTYEVYTRYVRNLNYSAHLIGSNWCFDMIDTTYHACFASVAPPLRLFQIATRLALLVVVGLSVSTTGAATEPSARFTAGHTDRGKQVLGGGQQDLKACSVHDLLPLSISGKKKSSEWSDDFVTEPPYDCTCATTKAR